MKKVDAKGKVCPQPLIMTRKAIEELKENDPLLILVDNEASMKNVCKFLEDHGMNPEIVVKGNVYEISVGKTIAIPDSTVETDYCEITIPENITKNIVIAFQDNKMGKGSDELGEILIKGFINTLPEMKPLPNTLIFLNAGITLTCSGSPVLETLKKLELQGTKILSCGTCLDYYGKMNELQVGNISNMYDILETLMKSTKTIYP
ncbi:MAG: sulfurtransferase-like selenium metabolism protein YedF [Bacteroidales bacterium]|nr:sulfurtransferase-like selenium metabolism protein YedF [Bacteroidales bacterium]